VKETDSKSTKSNLRSTAAQDADGLEKGYFRRRFTWLLESCDTKSGIDFRRLGRRCVRAHARIVVAAGHCGVADIVSNNAVAILIARSLYRLNGDCTNQHTRDHPLRDTSRRADCLSLLPCSYFKQNRFHSGEAP
jgi:hypothetical protein